jgi:glycerophosphoryl diester phosphodiesterase
MNILLDKSARPVVGHRGNRAHAPENTIESFAQAVAAGADAIEFDVRITSDGVAVVHHDPTVDRTTDGTGEIALKTFDELKRLDAGAKFSNDGGKTFPYRGKGHRIPTLDEVVEAFPSTPLLIEIKTPTASMAIRKCIEAHKAEERTVVDSMHHEALVPFHDSSIAYGAASGDVGRLMWQVVTGLAVTPAKHKALCVPLYYSGLPLPVKRFARVGPKYDWRVHVWTINDPSVALDLWKAGVNGIITDDPALMIRTRAQLGTT